MRRNHPRVIFVPGRSVFDRARCDVGDLSRNRPRRTGNHEIFGWQIADVVPRSKRDSLLNVREIERTARRITLPGQPPAR